MRRYGYFFTIFGALCVLQSIISFTLKARLIANSPHVMAVVVEYDTRSSDGIPVNYPILEFTTREGRVTRGTLNVGATEPPYAVGERVEATYSPADPTRVRVPSVWGLWLHPILMCSMGVVLLVPGVIMLQHSKKKGQANKPAGR